MLRVTSNYEPRIGGSCHIEVKNGKVRGDVDWAKYMRRAAEAWPFDKAELKDFVVVSENADWPFLAKSDPKADPSLAGPALTNSNNGNFWNIMMPVQSRPQFNDKFKDNRIKALALGKKVPWKERKDTAVWRGNLGCSLGCGWRGKAYFPDNHLDDCRDDSPHWDPNKVGIVYGCGDDRHEKVGAWMRHWRWALATYSATCGKECGIDAKFPDIGGEHRPFVVNYTGSDISRWVGGYMDDEKSAQHKYIFHVGNNGYADRSWRMFALGSVILLIDTGWEEWYWSMLQPFVHYVPIKADISDACEKLQWLRENPEEAEAIANRGRDFIEGCLNLDMVNIYCAEVMRQMGELWERGHKGSGR